MRKYRITSKFRFTLFIVTTILIITIAAGTLLGFNTVNSSSMTQYTQVRIESGDTIWSIAKEYAPASSDIRNAVSIICDVNDITADQLVPGQNIIIPVKM